MDVQRDQPVLTVASVIETEFLAGKEFSEHDGHISGKTGKKIFFRKGFCQLYFQISFFQRVSDCWFLTAFFSLSLRDFFRLHFLKRQHFLKLPGNGYPDAEAENNGQNQRNGNKTPEQLKAVMQGYSECQGKPDPADAAVQASAHLVGKYQLAFRHVFPVCFFMPVLLHNQINILQSGSCGWS